MIAAIILRQEVDKLRTNPNIKDLLSYERNAVPGNDYHGNILLKEEVNKPLMKKIAASLALCVTRLVPQGAHEYLE
jgi:hypothetical protein